MANGDERVVHQGDGSDLLIVRTIEPALGIDDRLPRQLWERGRSRRRARLHRAATITRRDEEQRDDRDARRGRDAP